MGALLLIAFLAFVIYIVTKGVLPYMGLRYLLRRAKGEAEQNRKFEGLVELGTGVQINTSDMDKEKKKRKKKRKEIKGNK